MNFIKHLFYIPFLLSIFFLVPLNAAKQPLPQTVVELYQTAKNTQHNLPIPNWQYQLFEGEDIFQLPIVKVDSHSKSDLQTRYERMLHTKFLSSKSKNVLLDRLYKLSVHTDKIASYIENKLYHEVHVQNISVYGSFLYNEIDPDDIDILVIVDGPMRVGHHFETTFEELTGEWIYFPKISVQIMDFQTYLKVRNITDFNSLNRPESMALQQLAVASSWYLTLYGYDMRYDNLKTVDEHTKLNFLNKSLLSMKAAGARLYKSAYQYLQPESDQVRLRKVLSRILISDFIIQLLDKSLKPSPETYNKIYQQLRTKNLSKFKNVNKIEEKIQKIYFDKLLELFVIAHKLGKINDISLTELE